LLLQISTNIWFLAITWKKFLQDQTKVCLYDWWVQMEKRNPNLTETTSEMYLSRSLISCFNLCIVFKLHVFFCSRCLSRFMFTSH
jgi:hypothetical protein